MAISNIDLTNEINKWKNAVYGKDVRAANVEAFEKIQTTVNQAIQDVNQASEDALSASENAQEAVDNITGYFPIPAEFMPNEECFMLTVQGESMINTGIYNGDHVIVKKCNTAENSDIVVALIDDSATVKRFYKEDGHIRLQPENDFMDPIIVDDCSIVGKVIGLIRWQVD